MIDISFMSLEDVDEVSEIENICFYTAWTKQDFIREMTENKLAIYLVARDERKIIGYAGMWHIVDEAHITNVAVIPDSRSCGIGSQLVKGLIDIALDKNIVAMTLEVRMGNLTAQKLYSKFGFRSEGLRKKYYTDTGEDAIIMWKYFNI